MPHNDHTNNNNRTCLRTGNDGKSCTVDISFEVKFIKSTWLRSMIESNTVSEMNKWEADFFAHLKQCATERVADRHVKLASIKEKLVAVVDDTDAVGRNGHASRNVVHKSMKKVVAHVNESMESWGKVRIRVPKKHRIHT